jgi:hypothetical protein
MVEMTPRLSLPLLQAGQAQKEALHNEAITILDAMTGGLIETIGDNAPPPSPVLGQTWIVGPVPVGEWAGLAQSVAVWTAGGWRLRRPGKACHFGFAQTACGSSRRLRAGATGRFRWPKYDRRAAGGRAEAFEHHASMRRSHDRYRGTRLDRRYNSGIKDTGLITF